MASSTVPAKASAPAAKIVPNQTMYCRNLPDKLRKTTLRRALYVLCSDYGIVLDVVALKTMKMRGQAHVVFRDVQSSTQAIRTLQGSEFLGKEMQVAYGKGRSNIISKLDGTFQIPVMREPGEASTTDAPQTIFDGPLAILPTDAAAAAAANGAASPPQGEQRQAYGQLNAEDEEDEGDAMMEESDED